MTNEEIRTVMLAPIVNRREPWRSETETQRKAIYRDCPAGVVVDREHQLARVGGVMQTGIGAPMARRALIRGLLSEGFLHSEVARALAASADELERAQGELPLWEAGVERMRVLLERVIPTLENDEGYNTSSDRLEERQGNIYRGSRGWRTPADGFPQTRSHLLDGRDAVPHKPTSS